MKIQPRVSCGVLLGRIRSFQAAGALFIRVHLSGLRRKPYSESGYSIAPRAMSLSQLPAPNYLRPPSATCKNWIVRCHESGDRQAKPLCRYQSVLRRC
jgi:hypothetical protein